MKTKLLLLIISIFASFCIIVNAQNISPAQRNKQTILHFYDLINQHAPFEKLNELFAIDAVAEESLSLLTSPRKAVENWNKAFPDHHTKIINVIAQGNQVFVHAETTGTQKGIYWGIKPTNKKTRWITYSLFIFNDEGKIIQYIEQQNDIEVMEQLGYIVL